MHVPKDDEGHRRRPLPLKYLRDVLPWPWACQCACGCGNLAGDDSTYWCDDCESVDPIHVLADHVVTRL